MNSRPLDGATIRALTSLTRRDVDAVRATARAAAMGHAVLEHDDYDGYLSVLVTPADAVAPSFLVAGKSGAVDLAEVRGDEMVAIGTFPSIGAAMLVLRPALERIEPPAATPAEMAEVLRQRHGDDASLQAALEADARPSTRHWPSVIRVLDGRDVDA